MQINLNLLNRFKFDQTNNHRPDISLNGNDNTNVTDFNQERNFHEQTIKPQRHLRNSNSPVDLDQFRALSNTNFVKHGHKICLSDSNCDQKSEQDIHSKKWSQENVNKVIIDTAFKDESVFLSPTPGKESHLRLDEKSSGYNSNQITPNSEINSAKSNAEQNSINKSSPKLGEVLVRKHIFTNTVVKTQRKVNLVKNNYKDEHFFKLLLDSNVIRSILYMS